jgi:thiol-disulfide isomerase/thioredoxin
MKIMNLVSSALLILLWLLTVPAKAQNTELSGQLKDFHAPYLRISYNIHGELKIDTVKVTDGNFSWKKDLNEPLRINVLTPRNYYSLFVQPGHIELTGTTDYVQTYKVSGSAIQQESETFESAMKDLTDQESQLYTKSGKGTHDEQVTVEAKLDDIKKIKNSKIDQYIHDHPKNFYSIYLILGRANYGVDYTEIKPLFDELDESAKQMEQGKKLIQRLEELKRSKIGEQMINFTQIDTAGKPVRFSSFKGKYVLIDFWASWCGPCRAENPNVLKAYNAYKDKGFTVVGISLDDNAVSWKKAIKDDKMPWIELADAKGPKNEVKTYYGIQGIPSNLLVDPSGKIVAKDLRGTALESKLKELMN